MNTRPNMRYGFLFSLNESIAKNDPSGIQASCINCKNFDEPKEICKIFNQRPPARVIALSCGPENYEDFDEIPF